MKTPAINEFLNELNSLIEENKKLREKVELYFKQLVIIGVNNEGKLKDLYYEDLNEIDFSKITVGIGYETISVCDTKGNLITNYKDLPKK